MSGAYAIPISGLKEGRHRIDFEIGKEFFEEYEESEVKEGSLIANIDIEKGFSHLDLIISISGNVNICCDRCLEVYLQPVKCEHRLLVKFGKSIINDDPDIISLPFDEHELDLKQHLYEFIYLAIPIKRVHGNDVNGNSTCNSEMLKKLDEHIIEAEKIIDPRWHELKKLMNDN
jgi:uncharacterized protein